MLNDSNVRTIRELYAAGGISQQALGDLFGVSQSVVMHVVTGRTHRDAGGPITHRGRPSVIHYANRSGLPWCCETGAGARTTHRVAGVTCATCRKHPRVRARRNPAGGAGV